MNVMRFDTQQCERIRRQLDAYLSNELLVETTSDVLRHLEGCEACSRELESRTKLRDALRKAAPSQLPPERLRQTIHQNLRKTQPGFWAKLETRNWVLAVAMVTVVLCAAVLGQRWYHLQQRRRLVANILSLGVSDHLHCAIQGHHYPDVANPPEQLRKKLGPEYAGLLGVVQQKLPDFQVLEAHICSVPGSPRKYIHFITRGRGTILSVILTKRGGVSLPGGRLLLAGVSGGVPLYHARLSGMEVVGFQYKDYLGFAVSDLGRNEMLQVAEGLAPALETGLSAGSESEDLGITIFRPRALQWRESSGA